MGLGQSCARIAAEDRHLWMKVARHRTLLLRVDVGNQVHEWDADGGGADHWHGSFEQRDGGDQLRIDIGEWRLAAEREPDFGWWRGDEHGPDGHVARFDVLPIRTSLSRIDRFHRIPWVLARGGRSAVVLTLGRGIGDRVGVWDPWDRRSLPDGRMLRVEATRETLHLRLTADGDADPLSFTAEGAPFFLRGDAGVMYPLLSWPTFLLRGRRR
jgi:hypothetical protein